MPITPLPQGIPYPDLTRTPDFPRPEVDLSGDGVQSYLDDSSDVIQTPTGGVQPAPEPTAETAQHGQESPQDQVIRIAQEEGVDPRIALSVWQQESSSSTDLSKRGPTIPKGKWKGSYGRGPWQIMSFHGEIPDTFEGQTRWAMKHLKERGVEGYYGKGSVPGMPNMPTSGQYAQQVMDRARGIDTRTASTDTMPPQMQVPGEPATGYSPVTMNKRDLEDASSMEKGLTNPYSMLGMGLLAVLGGPFGVLAIGAMNYGQSLKKDRYVKAGLLTPKNAQQPTALIQNLMAAGYQPGTPEFQQAMLSQLKQERGTTVEQQLEAAGYQPGTVEYQQAMQRYLFTPKSSVTVNNNPGQSYVPPEALGPVDPNDASRGYVYSDPNSPTGTKIVKPTGSTQATEGEVKSVGSLTAANDLLDQIDMSLDNGARVDGLIGLGREIIEAPTWLGGAARFGIDTVDKYFGTDLSSTPADRQALTAMESLRALIGQYISGADVPQEQIDNFKKWMPAAGDRQERIREKNASLRKYINTLAQAGELRQRDAPKPVAPAENAEVEAAKQRLRNAGLLE